MMAFITSIRHPRNCGSYGRVAELLGWTLRSVCAQTDRNFVVVVVCNEIPRCWSDDNVHFVTVDFPAPSPLKQPNTGIQAIRIDRGTKYLVGLMYARRFDPEHIMFFDADDLVSERLTRFVRTHSESANWYINQGYEYQSGGRTLRLLDDFHKHCGTSHIYHKDVFEIPDDISVDADFETIVNSVDTHYLMHVLGSHKVAIRHHRKAGHEFAPIPFPAAVWVLGTGENHSGRSGDPGDIGLDEGLIQEFHIPAGLRGRSG